MFRRTATAVCSLALTLVLLMALVPGPAGASVNLTTIGTADYNGGTYNLIYDNDRSLFWLDYSKGPGSWQTQMDWASNLLLTNVVTPGYTVTWTAPTWRLPTTDPAISGFNQAGSEMGHLYYTDLLLTAGNGVTGVGSANQLPFTKLVVTDWYWTGTERADAPLNAWYFDASVGYQSTDTKGGSIYAMAVRPGQLALGTSAVPEPSTYLLLGIGLGAVGYARRRMSAR